MDTVFRIYIFSTYLNFALAYGVIVATVLVGLANTGGVDGARALYVFGDSFVDTGNLGSKTLPYGSTWPGYPAGRDSEGRSQSDCFAELFGLPYPTPVMLLKNDSEALRGVNFARGGAGVSYAFGRPALVSQVDELEALVKQHVLTAAHLQKSVALVNIGINDYNTRNRKGVFQETDSAQELKVTVNAVVEGIAFALVRLYGLGVRNMVVSNLGHLLCSPYVSKISTFTSCSHNATLQSENQLHNLLLQQRVKTLNRNLRGLHIILVDQTKAFDVLFYYGSEYGFENPMTPCCVGKAVPWELYCGRIDTSRHPMYTLCKDPSKAVLFDTIHPTQAAWKTVINWYANVDGFTFPDLTLRTWMSMYGV